MYSDQCGKFGFQEIRRLKRYQMTQPNFFRISLKITRILFCVRMKAINIIQAIPLLTRFHHFLIIFFVSFATSYLYFSTVAASPGCIYKPTRLRPWQLEITYNTIVITINKVIMITCIVIKTITDIGPVHKAPPPVATQLVVPTELSDNPVS